MCKHLANPKVSFINNGEFVSILTKSHKDCKTIVSILNNYKSYSKIYHMYDKLRGTISIKNPKTGRWTKPPKMVAFVIC